MELCNALVVIPHVRLRHRPFLEGGALALEAAATAAAAETAAATTTTATTATTAAATEATTATATEAATATTTATATAAAEATTAVVVTGLGIVQTDGPAIKVTTVERVKGRLGILDRGEGHVGEALGTARLPDWVVNS